jgi:hypothetical protein
MTVVAHHFEVGGAKIEVFADVVEETVDRRATQAAGPVAIGGFEIDVDLAEIKGDFLDQELANGFVEISEHLDPRN